MRIFFSLVAVQNHSETLALKGLVMERGRTQNVFLSCFISIATFPRTLMHVSYWEHAPFHCSVVFVVYLLYRIVGSKYFWDSCFKFVTNGRECQSYLGS